MPWFPNGIIVLPAVLLFLLGLVNILSAVTPAIPSRLLILQQVIPLSAIHASTWLVLFSGLIMLVIAAFLLRGLRNAWIAGVILSGLSLFAHITKGIDWEEALLALLVISSSLHQRHQYFVRTDLKLAKRSFPPGILAVCWVIFLGTLGFYWLNPRHFKIYRILRKRSDQSYCMRTSITGLLVTPLSSFCAGV